MTPQQRTTHSAVIAELTALENARRLTQADYARLLSRMVSAGFTVEQCRELHRAAAEASLVLADGARRPSGPGAAVFDPKTRTVRPV